MAWSVTKVDVWAAEIADQPGGLARKLRALADAGANLEFVIARRRPDKPGTGVVFLTPLKGAKQTKAAGAAGFAKAKGMHGLRVEGLDKPGTGAALTEALAGAGLNVRGVSGAANGRRSVLYLAFDTAADAATAAKVLKKLK